MTGAGIAIRINKSAPGRIVISALEIIEPGAAIIDIADGAADLVVFSG